MSKAKTTEKKFHLPEPTAPGSLKRKLPLSAAEIEAAKARGGEPLLFSFKFLDREHKAFNLGSTERAWFLSLLDVLKDISDLSRNRLAGELKSHYRYHAHDWSEVRFTYPLDEDLLEQVECVQFIVTKGTGRVHGFVVGNRFYIVWLDPLHNLYQERHVEYSLYPENEYESLLRENARLKSSNEGLREENRILKEWFDGA